MNKNLLKYLKGAVILTVDALIVAASMTFAYLLTADYYVYDPSFIVWILAEIGVTVIAFTLTGMYSVVYSSVGITEAIKLTAAVLSVGALNMIVWSVRLVRYGGTRVATVIAFTAFMLYFAGLSRFYKRLLGVGKYYIAGRSKPKKKVLVIGAGEAGLAVIKEMRTSDKIALDPVCILDDDPEKAGKYVYGVKVIGGTDRVKSVCDKYAIEEIFVAMPSVDKKTLGKILSRCSETNRMVRSIPGTYQILNDKVSVSSFKNVEIQDLLGREQVTVDMDEIMGYIENKVVLVTGGGGSIGSELCRQIATHRPRQLIILDIYENNAYDIEQELKRKYHALNLLTLIASVRDKGKMKDVFEKYRPQIVFHAAAHKHVPLMETSPNEAVKNNVFGTLNTARLADEYKSETFVLISTDKAVNPTNVMGATKRICEMIVQTIGKNSKNTKFVAVRFGNVLGSNGSVIPLFKKQIAEGGPVTVTHKDIIRYFMTIPEAVSLVLQAGAYAKGGQIFVLDMGDPVRIYDLAVNLIKLSGLEPDVDIDIVCTGLRPGEKLFEERLMDEEGMQKTPNGLINIARPIPLDEQMLWTTLDKLYEKAYEETDEMKDLVKTLVPTYKIDKTR